MTVMIVVIVLFKLAIADPSGRGSNTGVAFAIPVDTVKPIVEQIVRYGRVVRPQLGVTIAPEQALRALGTQGVLVLSVEPGSGAARAGMLPTKRDPQGEELCHRNYLYATSSTQNSINKPNNEKYDIDQKNVTDCLILCFLITMITTKRFPHLRRYYHRHSESKNQEQF